MSLPHSTGPHNGQVPYNDKAIGVAREEPLVAVRKNGGVDLRSMAAEDATRGWWGGWVRHLGQDVIQGVEK